jgi:hypothetical protein
MHGAVKRGPRIEVPSARDDELAVRSLVASSIACLAAGLLLAYATADAPEETRASTATEQHDELAPSASAGAAEPPPPPQPALELTTDRAIAEPDAGFALSATLPEPLPQQLPEALPEPASAGPDAGLSATPTADAPAQDAPDQDTPAIPPSEAEVPVAAAAASKLRISSGVVAYLRCDGLAQREGPIPCPRDRTLETRMREIIDTLPNCREAHAITRGNFEIRLEHVATGAVRDLMVRAPDETADRAVRACAGAALRKVRTELKPTRMIVAMRFKAR